MTGLDLQAATADDYTVELVYEPDCSSADIRVEFVPIDGLAGILGSCFSDIEPIGSEPVQLHYRLVPLSLLFDQLTIRIDADDFWNILQIDDFETGNTSRWDEVVP